MEASTLLKRLAVLALPLLASCHANTPVPPETDALIREFITHYDHAINEHQFALIVPMYVGDATITIKNPFIYELTRNVPSSPADKAAYDRIAAGNSVTPTQAFAPMAAEKNLGYALSRSAIDITRDEPGDQYIVRSKVKENICSTSGCMITLTDDKMVVALRNGKVHIQSDYQTVTALPTPADAGPAPASSR